MGAETGNEMTGNVLLYAFLATTGTYALTALGAAIVLLWIPTPQQLQTVMALAVGLMLSAVFDIFSSAHEEAVDMYGDNGAETHSSLPWHDNVADLFFHFSD